METYPEELKAIRNHLVVRGFLKVIHNIHVGIDLRKSLMDAELTTETVLEKALWVFFLLPPAVTRIEEEERKPKVAALQPDKTEI